MAQAPEFALLTPAADVAAAFPESVKDKTIIITGVSPNSLGLATAFALASQRPARLILSGRSADKVQASIDTLKSDFPDVRYDVLLMDLSSQASVRAAAGKINNAADITGVDILINNAGVMAIPQLTFSEDGIETTFATNHIGHFLFTNLIVDKLIAASKSSPSSGRVVNVSSYGHQFSPVRFSDSNFSKKPAELPADERPDLEKASFFTGRDWTNDAYMGFFSYGQSKTANILFSVSLNQKLQEKHGIVSYAVHPGTIQTGIIRHTDPQELLHALARAEELGASSVRTKTPEQGANSIVLPAVNHRLPPPELSEDIVKGVYVSDCAIADGECSNFAKSKAFAEKLWELSEDLVQQKFNF